MKFFSEKSILKAWGQKSQWLVEECSLAQSRDRPPAHAHSSPQPLVPQPDRPGSQIGAGQKKPCGLLSTNRARCYSSSVPWGQGISPASDTGPHSNQDLFPQREVAGKQGQTTQQGQGQISIATISQHYVLWCESKNYPPTGYTVCWASLCQACKLHGCLGRLSPAPRYL